MPVNLVHLIYRANAWEGGSRDFEFSARTMREHWDAGPEAVSETMANARLVAPNILDGRSAAFDLTDHLPHSARKRVVSGQSESVRIDLGGRRTIKKKK